MTRLNPFVPMSRELRSRAWESRAVAPVPTMSEAADDDPADEPHGREPLYEFDTVLVCLLPTGPTEYCHQDLPHLTLVYAGGVVTRTEEELRRLRDTCATLARTVQHFTAPVTGGEVLGPPDERVDVLIFEKTPELEAMRAALEWANASDYTEFKPHLTVGAEGTMTKTPGWTAPPAIDFDRICMLVGPDQQTWILADPDDSLMNGDEPVGSALPTGA